MDTRLTIINQFYDQGGEEERLSRSRQGQLEFLTTMRYIHRWSGHKMNILEIGAGTGRWAKGGVILHYQTKSLRRIRRIIGKRVKCGNF